MRSEEYANAHAISHEAVDIERMINDTYMQANGAKSSFFSTGGNNLSISKRGENSASFSDMHSKK